MEIVVWNRRGEESWRHNDVIAQKDTDGLESYGKQFESIG